MSSNPIGKFIQQLRKEKGLTQKELGNLINVSDKTISKWENSNSIPDMVILPALCEALDITVNELVYGEKLPPEDYSKKAEENIMNLLQEGQANKKSEIWSFLILAGIWAAIVLISGKRRKEEILPLLRKTVIPVGLIVSIVSSIGVLGQMAELKFLGVNLAVAVLALLYSAIAYVILCILEQRLNVN